MTPTPTSPGLPANSIWRPSLLGLYPELTKALGERRLSPVDVES